jgi:hypothetical protein
MLRRHHDYTRQHFYPRFQCIMLGMILGGLLTGLPATDDLA